MDGGGGSVDRRMHATETSFGSQDGKQATERRGRGGRGRGRGSLASEQRGLISSGDKSPPTLTNSIVPTSVPSHVFAKRSFPGTEEFIPLEEEGSPPDEIGVGKQGRENMDEYEGRRKRRRVCLSITARRGRGRKAHPSLGLHPLKSLTHFGLAVFEARKT